MCFSKIKLSMPKAAPDEIKNVIGECLELQKEKRPEFTDILKRLLSAKVRELVQ